VEVGMKKPLMIVGCLLATSCAKELPPEVRSCEAGLVTDLLAPSTYKRVDYTVSDIVVNKRPVREVTINYDAQNAFGAPLRQVKDCRFLLNGGEADIVNEMSDYEVGQQLRNELYTENLSAEPHVGKFVTSGK
jgi:hypothetical protein